MCYSINCSQISLETDCSSRVPARRRIVSTNPRSLPALIFRDPCRMRAPRIPTPSSARDCKRSDSSQPRLPLDHRVGDTMVERHWRQLLPYVKTTKSFSPIQKIIGFFHGQKSKKHAPRLLVSLHEGVAPSEMAQRYAALQRLRRYSGHAKNKIRPPGKDVASPDHGNSPLHQQVYEPRKRIIETTSLN